VLAQGAPNPHAVQPERPTVATHAHTVAPGWLELEEGGEWDSFSDGSKSFSAPTNLKIGLAERAQLNLMGSVLHDAGSTAVSDVTAGVKYRLLDDAKVVGDFAILPAVKIPTASTKDGAGTGTTDLSLLLISSHEEDGVSIDINAGATHRSGDGSRIPKTSTLWTTSFGIPVRGDLGWAVELFGFPGTAGRAGQKGSAALLTGPTFSAREWLAFDAGIIERLMGPQPRAIYAGFVWNLGML
jgi:hypothetical protein